MSAFRTFVSAYAFSMTLMACAAGGDQPANPWTPGKGDGAFDIREIGPLEPGITHELALDGFVPALRVESFGGTRIALTLAADSVAPFVVVEGPIDGAAPGSATVIGQADAAVGDSATLTVTLPAAGVYRVLAGTQPTLGLGEAPTPAQLTLASTCEASCARPSIPHVDFAQQFAGTPQAEALFATADAQIIALFPDPETRDSLRAQLAAIKASPSLEGFDRFPTVSIEAIGTLRPALGLIEAEAPAPNAVINGELAELLGACSPDYSYPSAVNASVPGMLYGHWPNRALTDCQVSHSNALAQILTSLASGNGSSVTYDGRTLATPEELATALLDTGHRIELRNERTYANFISLTTAEAEVRWPVWLDTGLAMSDGTNLAIPMGHSHHAWRITGPVVNARVMFYLGMFGAGFFAQTDNRPLWTGLRVHESSTDRAQVIATFDIAARYLGRILTERATVAAGRPADGYGYLGVCNDSNALIEYMTRGTITTYPLLRAAALDASEGADGLSFSALPHDADAPESRADILRRVLLMSPHALGSALFPDARLRVHMSEAAGEVGDGSP